MFINLMKKTVSKLWQRWQRFWEPINEIPPIIRLLLGVLVVTTVAVFISKSVADCLQQLLSEKYDVLKVIGYCVAGVVSIWLAWAANKRANAIDATAREQVNATKNTEEGQRQERLKNAIEHLGHGSESVRMGGAHELFHLAKDTEDLRQTVMDILCAHIRQTTRGNAYQAKYKTKASEEIQNLLTLLFMAEHDVFEDCSINLQGSYLNGAILNQARLQKANLMGAQLQGANLMNTRLKTAVLMEAQLQRANLMGAQLQGADLSATQLQKTNLSTAQLRKANLSKAQLQGAKLLGTRLQEAVLEHVQLQGANLFNAQLQGTVLRQAQMQGANFWDAKMQGADLMAAQLQGANLMAAQLQGAILMETQLQGVSCQEHHIPSARFENEIRNRIGKPSDLTGIVFAGGLQQEDLDALCEGLSAEEDQELRKALRPLVRQPVSHELPKNSGAETGAYTQEEAEQWIAEYNKAMEKVPSADDN